MTSLVALSAGLSTPSSSRMLTDLLVEKTVQALGADGEEPDVVVAEVRDHAHAITDALLTHFASGDLATLQEQVAAADGLIVVSPIFSAGVSGLFKSFFDALDPLAIVGTPLLMGATAGTARHTLALEYSMRPLFTYLKANVMGTSVFAASEDFAGGGAAPLTERGDRAARELASAMSGGHAGQEVRDTDEKAAHRASVAGLDDGGRFTPMDTLLHRHD